jgi:hypothetical protein
MRIIRATHLGMCFGVRDAIALAHEHADAGPLTIQLVLAQKGRDLSGTLASAGQGEGTVTFGRVAGRGFAFSARVVIDGEPTELEIKGQSKDGALEGKLSGPFGDDVAWTGRKDP